VGFRGVELGDFAGIQVELAFPDDDADRAGEDVEPFAALVGDKFRFPGCVPALPAASPPQHARSARPSA
jgi:hypothetical protein